jgi:hypothetical protein
MRLLTTQRSALRAYRLSIELISAASLTRSTGASAAHPHNNIVGAIHSTCRCQFAPLPSCCPDLHHLLKIVMHEMPLPIADTDFTVLHDGLEVDAE